MPQELQVKELKHSPLEGITTWVNPINGFTCIDLEYKADPEKRAPEWRTQSQQGMPKAEWDREYGSSWVVYDGKSVYQDYNEIVHVMRGNIYAVKKQKLICGYDAGPNDVYLAWCLGLVNPIAPAVTWIDEYLQEDGDVTSFLEIVVSRLRQEWAKLGGFITHVVDQSSFTQSRLTKDRTAVKDIMRSFGIFPIPGEISFSKRRQIVEDLLFKPVMWGDDGLPVPRMRFHERCILLREAMQGGYHYPKNISQVGDMYRPLPVKNKFSHIANAMEYASSKIGTMDYEIPFNGRKLPRMNRI